MSNFRIVLVVIVAAILIAGGFGYWFYFVKKGAVVPVFYNKTGDVSPTTTNKSLIPEIFLSGKATLSWNANKETDLAGYKIYYGASPRTGSCPLGGYPQKVDVGNKTSYSIDKLEKGKTYYFSITAYNKAGKESCFSAEVKKTIK